MPPISPKKNHHKQEHPNLSNTPFNSHSNSLKKTNTPLQQNLCYYLQQHLPEIFPSLFTLPPRIEILNRTGVNGLFYEVTRRDGERFFLKAQKELLSSSHASNHPLQTESETKEEFFRRKSEEQKLPTAQVFPPAEVTRDALPEGLVTLLSSDSRNYLLSFQVQSFIEGNEGYQNFSNNELQRQIHYNLGKTIRRLNSIPTAGFGPHFLQKTQTFAETWHEHLTRMNLGEKVNRLVEVGILSRSEEKACEEIVAPLFDFKPDPVLLHTDLNPGNYLCNEGGDILALLDADTVESNPWQKEVALFLVRVESNTFYAPSEERKRRAQEFLKGYSRSARELASNKEVLQGIMASDCINRLWSVYGGRNREPYVEGAWRGYATDQFPITATEGRQDFTFARLGREAILRGLIHGDGWYEEFLRG